MRNNNPIMIVEDDSDDSEIITSALLDIGVTNELIYFKNGQDALNYLITTSSKTFLILCDVNMPKMNGLELKERSMRILHYQSRSIPFVFFSTSAVTQQVKESYEMKVQGFFKKPSNYKDVINCLKRIVDYWDDCYHPNSVII